MRFRVSLQPGEAVHLGGPWWLARLPDSGRFTYEKDCGRSAVPVDARIVPKAIRERVELPEVNLHDS
jgi:hypothetical protein